MSAVPPVTEGADTTQNLVEACAKRKISKLIKGILNLAASDIPLKKVDKSVLEATDAPLASPEQFAELVRWRRDVRRFKTDRVPAQVINGIVNVADMAPSVGNSQPWRIISVEAPERRASMRDNFCLANRSAGQRYEGEQRAHYQSLKLAGFDAAPVHLAVFCDRATGQGHKLGRDTMPETLDYSCVCMIMVLWLAARAEGLGLGWVSILDPARVSRDLEVPDEWALIGYLLLGYPEEEHLDPELERHNWQKREAAASRIIRR